MARNIYITAMGPHSGKSVVALGFVEMLSARLQRVGFFRPVIRSAVEPDPQIELMRHRYQLEQLEAGFKRLESRSSGNETSAFTSSSINSRTDLTP